MFKFRTSKHKDLIIDSVKKTQLAESIAPRKPPRHFTFDEQSQTAALRNFNNYQP